MRIGTPLSLAACAIPATWSSNLRMLPGLTRTPAQPASMAANTYLGWKWMSAMTGIWDLPAMIGSAAASSAVGQATRTISQPEAVSSAICCRVALMSVVCVVVIDCTLTGDSDPTPTLPTLICRVCRRGASTGGGDAGIPRLTDVKKTIPSVGLVTSHDDRAVAEAGPSCGQNDRPKSIEVPPPSSYVHYAARYIIMA